MSNVPIPPKSRKELEHELLDRVRIAQDTYRAACAAYLEVSREYAGMLKHPDGAYALHRAAAAERVALEEYSSILKTFCDLVIRGRRPEGL